MSYRYCSRNVVESTTRIPVFGARWLAINRCLWEKKRKIFFKSIQRRSKKPGAALSNQTRNIHSEFRIQQIKLGKEEEQVVSWTWILIQVIDIQGSWFLFWSSIHIPSKSVKNNNGSLLYRRSRCNETRRFGTGEGSGSQNAILDLRTGNETCTAQILLINSTFLRRSGIFYTAKRRSRQQRRWTQRREEASSTVWCKLYGCLQLLLLR